MWLDETNGFAEFWKGSIPYYLLIVLPILIIISPGYHPVSASLEFNVFRMQQYDLHGVAHGCRSASVNLEARSLTGWGSNRHCVITHLQNLTIDHFRDIKSKAGALLVILPDDFQTLSFEEKEHLMLLEASMLTDEVMIPVYFAQYSDDLMKIATEVSDSYKVDEKSVSGTEALLNSIAANGYQIVINPGSNNQKSEIKIASIQGRLSGLGTEGKTPTIAIVAHYDSFGIAPELSFGADSNGSGVAVLLELARLFSILYSNPNTHGKFNLIFLLTGGGKFNYQGSKKWLDDQLESVEGSIVQEAQYVMCLDSISHSPNLYMHVSKPPKEGTAASQFFRELKNTADSSVEGVHKKINLADELLSWEHERFSIRRLPAFTISSLKSHRDHIRNSIMDTKESINKDTLTKNTKAIAEALARHIYNFSEGQLFTKNLSVSTDFLNTYVTYLSSQSRATQMHCDKQNPLVNTLKNTLSRYTKDVKVSYVTPDKREPEFMFYDVTRAVLNIYSVKPAVFDLVLTLAIVLYLCIVYLVLQHFSNFYNFAAKISSYQHSNKLKSH